MDKDGWITPVQKRPKLSLSLDQVDVVVDLSGADERLDTSGTSGILKPPEGPQPCQYGVKCYRRNVEHLLEFSHPILDKIYEAMQTSGNFSQLPPEFDKTCVDLRTVLEQIRVLKDAKNKQTQHKQMGTATSDHKLSSEESSSSKTWTNSLSELREERRKKFLESKVDNASKSTPRQDQITATSSTPAPRNSIACKSMLEKWELSRPFNYFLTKVSAIRTEISGVFSASFKDLFDPSLGEVKAVVHINYMVDPDWLMEQTLHAGLAGRPTRIIFDGVSKELQDLAAAFSWVKVFGVKSPFPFGHHHTKMSIVQYSDLSIRFIIYTANLIESDWENRTQGIWISPRCPKINSSGSPNDGDSPTKFRSDMIQYLSTYPMQASRAWTDIIKTVDCSEIKVYLIASAPVTTTSGSSGFQWGSCKVQKVLKSLDFETDPSWPLVMQCSSIGTLGKGIEDWIQGELGSAFAGKDHIQKGPIHVVYPSLSNVKSSFEGLHGGGCLPYSASTHKKQTWLEKHLCQWKADRSGRSRAVPHVKSYFRISPDPKSNLAWFLLTSANLSKAAWGKLNKNRDRLSVMSWEAGVLFIPQVMISQNYFHTEMPTSRNCPSDEKSPPFPLHIDVPVVKYETSDKPWFMDTLQALILQNSD